jgi:uncharacterized protein (DUF427 family)
MTTDIQQRRQNSPDGKDHYHVTRAYSNPIRVRVDGQVVARTDDALLLQEATDEFLDPVFYIPREDVDLDKFEREEGATSKCPIKGTASYFTYSDGDRTIEEIAWSYEDPKDYSKMIENHFAFYQDHAEIDILPGE